MNSNLVIIIFVLLMNSISGYSYRAEKKIPISEFVLTVDGKLDDQAWKLSPFFNLEHSEKGVPQNLGGNVRFIMCGSYLCIGSFCPEPGGKVIAKYVGYNPDWAKDLPDGPDLEDRMRFKMSFSTPGGKTSVLFLEINPWGAIRVKLDGEFIPKPSVLAAAYISKQGWVAETAIPLGEFYLVDNKIKDDVKQIRSIRPFSPGFHWKFPGKDRDNVFIIPETDNITTPDFKPPLTGNTEPPLEVGYRQKVPPIDASWNDRSWNGIPAWKLSRNETNPRKPKYPTDVKFVSDGKTLALFFRCSEDERLDCDLGGRDSNEGSDDHICIYFATSGSSVIEILVNPAEAIRDSKITGSHMSVSPGAWNGNIEKHCLKMDDAWYVRLDVPLAELAIGLDELNIPSKWKVLIARVRQTRIGEPREISSIPVIGNPHLVPPARYRRLHLTDKDPTEIGFPESAFKCESLSGLAEELSLLNSNVLSREEKRYFNVSGMLSNNIRKRIRSLARKEQKEWAQVNTLEDWGNYSEKRIQVIKDALGDFPENRSPLSSQVTGTYKGEGYQLKNVVYQSQPGIIITANLFLPENPKEKMPGIIIIPGHHYPRKEGELRDCGMIWARSGCAVLVMEKLGMGELIENLPWHRRPYQSEYLINLQLDLVGQSRYMDSYSCKQELRKEMSEVLIDIHPNKNPEVKIHWSKKLIDASIEALTVITEPGIIVPVVLIKPDIQKVKQFPLVIAISEGGKDRFLKNRSNEIKKLIDNGIAVCISDVKGTGETAPDQYNRNSRFAYKEFELGKTLLGLRLKDLRTVMGYIKKRDDIHSERIALWGDSFAPANEKEIWVYELAQRPVSPQIQHYASPLGAHLALFASLYEENISAVAVRGGLIGYSSILDHNFTYVPTDIVVPKILKTGDISDICASLTPMPLYGKEFVDGRNYITDDKKHQKEMNIVKEAYQKTGNLSNLEFGTSSDDPELIYWLIDHLKK